VALIVWRRLQTRRGGLPPWRRLALPWALSFGVALAVGSIDYQWADRARHAASILAERYRPSSGTLWFQGAWGFQHYMEAHGGQRLSRRRTVLLPGDVMIIPHNNSNIARPPADIVSPLETLELPGPSLGVTMSRELGAGFYSSAFVFGSSSVEDYQVDQIVKGFDVPNRRRLP
jgi:hypothetical protein